MKQMDDWKKILIVIVCLVAAAALVFAFMLPPVDKIDIARDDSSGPTGSVPQVLTQEFPAQESAAYIVKAEYPKLQGVSTPGVQDKVNTAIQAAIYNQISAFHEANSRDVPFEDPNMRSSFDASFKTTLVTRSVFSALMLYSDYSAGAAHPSSYNIALNYDLKTGERLSLEEFFRRLGSSSGYMERLASRVRQDLVRQFGDTPGSLEAINFGASARPENYANFTLDTTGFSVHFDPYQVAPYAAGAPEVKIPYSELVKDIAKPSGVAGSSTSTAEWWLK